MMQDVVLSLSIVLMAILIGVFIWVALSARVAVTDSGPMISSAYRMRSWLFGIGFVALIAVNARTLTLLPYAATHERAAPPTQLVPVQAVGRQWSWSIKPDTFTVGQTAEFRVTSLDVNHGFAIYGPDMRIVTQTQAMPGYTNILRYTFTQPGVYQVMCLEYCGVGHHTMAATLKIAAQ